MSSTVYITLTTTYTLSSGESLLKTTRRTSRTSLSESISTTAYESNFFTSSTSANSPNTSSKPATRVLLQSSTDSSPITVDNYPTTHSIGMSSLAKLGMAIGIPLAVISLFLIIIAGWYFWKKRKFDGKKRNAISPYKDNFLSFDTSEKFDHDGTNRFMNDGKLTEKQNGSFKVSATDRTISSEWFAKNRDRDDEATIGARDIENLRQPKPSFLNRLSRLIISNDSELSLSRPIVPSTPGLKTPTFLKKFNLHHSPSQDSVQLPPLSDDPPQKRKPPKFPPLISTYNANPTSLQGFENALPSNTKGRKPTGKKYIVIRDYQRQKSDELTIQIGDQAVIIEEHLDGWCLVQLTFTHNPQSLAMNAGMKKGVIPKLCLREFT